MNDERYEQFEQEVADLRVRGVTARETWLGRLGVALIVIGPVVGVVAYFGSLGAEDSLAQRDMIVLGLFGVSLTVAGVGLFLRYSVVRFFRFWAARIVYELTDAANATPKEDRDAG